MDDIELFGWEPRTNRITVGAHLTAVERRCALALAMAHRALGHIGNSLYTDLEARLLATRWVIPPTALVAAINEVGTDPDELAEHLMVSPLVLRAALGEVCHHVSNLEAFRRTPCACKVRDAA